MALITIRRNSDRKANDTVGTREILLNQFSMRLSLQRHRKHFHSREKTVIPLPKVIETRDQSARWWNKEF